MIYLVVFASSAFFLYCSARCRGVLAGILASAGILLPCLLAGLRDETIGVDVLTYAKWMCLNAQSMGFLEFLQHESAVAAIGWNVFTWATVRIAGGLPGYLFAIELLCILPVYFALRRMCPGGEWAGMLIWLCLCFAFSLNGMRQCAAMGIVFYGQRFVAERRPLAFCLSTAGTMLLHQTAAAALAFYPLSLLIADGGAASRFLGKWKPQVVAALVAAGLGLLFAFGRQLVTFAAVLKDSYSYQLAHLDAQDVSYSGLWLLAVAVILWTWLRGATWKPLSGNATSAGSAADDLVLSPTQVLMLKYVLAMAIVGALLWQLNYVANTLGRLGYYGTMLLPLGGGLLCLNGKATRSSLLFLVVASIVFFVATALVLGLSGVYPYTSRILGIG